MSKRYFDVYSRGLIYAPLLLKDEEQPERPVYDVTAKFAEYIIETLKQRAINSNEPAHKLWEHVERYEAILDRHITYKKSWHEGREYK